jgi:hypothetical protein
MAKRNKRALPGQPACSYRIDTIFEGRHIFTHSVVWRRIVDGPPPQWEQTKHNPAVVRAQLIKSGRKIDTYKRL